MLLSPGVPQHELDLLDLGSEMGAIGNQMSLVCGGDIRNREVGQVLPPVKGVWNKLELLLGVKALKTDIPRKARYRESWEDSSWVRPWASDCMGLVLHIGISEALNCHCKTCFGAEHFGRPDGSNEKIWEGGDGHGRGTQ